jgi:AcrR family transcriptional regulator
MRGDSDVNAAYRDVSGAYRDVNGANLPSEVNGVNMEGMDDPVTPTRARYHHGDLRQALLDKALELIAERGPEGFSLREAAREVGVSPAAAYRHFADKPAVLMALAAEGHGRLAVAMEKGADKLPATEAAQERAVARLLAIGQAYVDFAVKNPSFFRVMFGPAIKADEFAPCCSPVSGRDAYEILCATLDEVLESGAMPAERRPAAEITVWSAVHGLATLIVDGALPLTARQRTEAYQAMGHSLLLALGYTGAVPPPAPPSWKGPHAGHARRAAGAAPGGPRGAQRR